MTWTAARRDRVRAQRRRAGLCRQCGRAPVVDGGRLCAAHREAARIRCAEQRALTLPQALALAALRDARADRRVPIATVDGVLRAFGLDRSRP